jgi:glycosyltransferase involved in cell wall biosynthesis
MRDSEIKVLLVIEGEIATTQLIERVLQSGRASGLTYSKVSLWDLSFPHFSNDTVPLFVRCGDPDVLPWIELLRRAGHPYVYYIDDNFWEIKGNSPLAEHYRRPEIRKTLETAVSCAHSVLTNSEVLASYLHRFTKRLRVLPSFFDFSLIEGCSPEPTPELRIGFAGSPTRSGDLELIRPLIQPVLDRLPDAVFEFAGAMPAGVEPGPRIRFFEHTTSYADYLRFQVGRNWAIGLAPLIDNPSNRAKTNNKYREYGACRIAGIYSDLTPYHGSVQPGVTGLLAPEDPDAWLSAIIGLASQPDRRRMIAESAARDVRARFCVERVAGEWVESFRETQAALAARPSRLERVYYRRIVAKRLLRAIHVLWLQVRDAYAKGGIRMVALKTVQRVGSVLFPRRFPRAG